MHSGKAKFPPSPVPVVDYAIVGGGVAGVYAAWRLSTFSDSVELYETDSRIGGRLFTAMLPGLPYRAELGGMRYTNRHVLLKHTITALGLDWIPFSFDCRFVFLRGAHYLPNRVSAYRVRFKERGLSPGELIMVAIRSALIDLEFGHDTPEIHVIRTALASLASSKNSLHFGLLSAAQWEFVKKEAILRGAHLFEIGFWNLLQFYLSSEAFLLVHDGLGYESIVANWNAAEAIPWYLRDFDAEYRTLTAGMGELPLALQYTFQRSRPDQIHLDHKLTHVENRGELVALHFNGSDEGILARHVILALPPSALEGIGFSGFSGNVQLSLALKSVTAHPLFKLFLGYPRAWWNHPRGLGCSSGRAITDLPIRQVYYFGPDQAAEPTEGGMLMASYSDSHYVDFWTPLHVRRTRPPFYTGPALDERDQKTLDACGVSHNMVRKAHHQIRLLHPSLASTESIPDPYIALVKEWPAGWHTWNVHAEPWDMVTSMIQPLGGKVFVCGEAFSREQGWIEGALRSTELVLKRLGCPPPAIAAEEYTAAGYLGYDEYIRS